MYKCSVVILTYNCELSKLLLTLESVVRQQKIDYEIIVADDCSEVFDEEAIKAYLKMKAAEYRIVRQKKNVGTVKNVYEALLQCRGEYVKLIGSGDLLYAPDTLYKMCQAMEETGSTAGFGLMKSFFEKDGVCQKQNIIAPNNIDAFIRNDMKEIYNTIVKYEQWICGASLIYNTRKIIPFVKEIAGKVKYCEDMMTQLVVMEHQKICFTKCYSVWYEIDSGISNNTERKYAGRVLADQVSFYKIVQREDRFFWRRLGKKMIHKVSDRRVRTLLKLVFQPGIVLLSLKTRSQAKKGMYELDEKGFLDDSDYKNNFSMG